MPTIPQKRTAEEIDATIAVSDYEARIAILNQKIEAQNRRIEAQNSKIEAETRRIEAQIGRIEAQTREQIEKSVYRYLVEGGTLPEITQCGSDSGPMVSTNKMNVKCVHGDFGCVMEIDEALKERSRNTTSLTFNSSGYRDNYYGSERDVQGHVYKVIIDILSASSLYDQLDINFELKITSLDNSQGSDHIVINCEGFHLGAVVIKKPGLLTEYQEPKVYGQLYDYMAMIQSFCGVKHALGIFTNYNEWVICWFPESNDCATATTLDYECVHVPPPDTSKRELCVSTTYTRSNTKQLFIALCSAFKKMAKNLSSAQPPLFLSHQRNYIAMPLNGLMCWEKRSFPENLSLQSFTIAKPTLYLLCDCRAGSDGRVWLACDGEAHFAVIKFLGNEDADDKEVSYWHLLGFHRVYYGYYDRVASVVLPYAFTYRKDQYDQIGINYSRWKVPVVPRKAQAEAADNSDGGDSDDIPRNLKLIDGYASLVEQLNAKDPIAVLRECIQKCIDNQLVHNDIKWRHVGLFPVPREGVDGYDLIANFIDLTDMRQVGSKAEAEESMKAEFEKLAHEPWNV